MKILMATGGSGGHIFPAVQTAAQLRQRGHTVVFAGALSMAKEKLEAQGYKVYPIGAKGFRMSSIKGFIQFFASLIRSIGEAGRIVQTVQPDRVVGFGGYGSFAVILVAAMRRIPAMIHEQNVVPGKANRILGFLVPKVAISFQESRTYFGSKSIWTGCPCHDQASRKERSYICNAWGLDPTAKIVALLGGSQGSAHLNNIFFETIKEMTSSDRINVVHVTGAAEYERYALKYVQEQVPGIVRAFLSPIEDLYAVADVLVSRAGAATVSEIGAHGVNCILIPYPYAGAHQKYNAQVLEKSHGAAVLDQKKLTKARLLQTIRQALNGAASQAELIKRSQGVFVLNADVQLAMAIEQ